MTAKLGEIYTYEALSVSKKKHTEFEKVFPIHNPVPMIDPHALIGVEIEVENMKNGVPDCEYYWNVKQDNSLRNNGLEFTSIPLRAEQLEHALNYYNERVNQNNKPDYSNRTSVHVHLNVRDMTWDQVKNFVILYCLFEKHFFHIAGTKRESSIFCVPLYKTSPKNSITGLEQCAVHWHKYYALNLCTLLGSQGLPMYGTIEFRHLYGTGDKNIIINWVNNILALRKQAMSMDLQELLAMVKNMNTTSEYVTLYRNTFNELTMLDKMHKYDFESCVSFVKTWQWGHTLKEKYLPNSKSVYYTKYHPADEAFVKPKYTTNAYTEDLHNPETQYLTHHGNKVNYFTKEPKIFQQDGQTYLTVGETTYRHKTHLTKEEAEQVENGVIECILPQGKYNLYLIRTGIARWSIPRKNYLAYLGKPIFGVHMKETVAPMPPQVQINPVPHWNTLHANTFAAGAVLDKAVINKIWQDYTVAVKLDEAKPEVPVEKKKPVKKKKAKLPKITEGMLNQVVPNEGN